jgi:CMP-N-acetylneuraminic acid synthetase
MYKDKKILAFIPARGGSEGLPGKNIKPMVEKPLIAWTIEQARDCSYFDSIVVSTDDEGIASIAREFKASVPFLRPAELARGETPIIDVIRHFLNKVGEDSYDILALLEPTSPLRKEDDLCGALAALVDRFETADSVVSVGEVHLESPFICKVVENGFVTSFLKTQPQFYQRQQLPTVLFPYGVIYASKVETLLQDGTFYQQRCIPYTIERWQNYEIDDVYDFLCVESILKQRIEAGMI